MVSKIFALAALSGMAFANYNATTGAAGASNSTAPGGGALAGAGSGAGSSGNSTTGAGSGTTAANNASALSSEDAFCGRFSGKANLGYEVGDITYVIECGVTHDGIFIDIDITLGKRAVPQGLPDCIDNCNAITNNAINDNTAKCVGTAFSRDTLTCTYYSEVRAAHADASVDFALVVDIQGAGSADGAGALAGSAVPLTTSVVPASTVTNTIYSCAATVTDCPYGSVQTSVVEAYTTVCPGNVAGAAATSGLAAPVACTNCPYYAKVVTVYTATCPGNGAVTSYVPVDTKVINIPTPTATGVSTGLTTTVCTACAATEATQAPGSGSKTSGVVAFTGAAQHVEAGMGMAALIGAAALLI